MQVGIIGINHFSSTLLQREQVAKTCREKFSKELPFYYVLLSTCNRTEIYFSASHLTKVHSEVLQLMREDIQEPFDQSLYSYFGADCFLHLGRVISGMDSLIFGESDIQHQVKVSYEMARKKRKLTPALHYLFQKGLKIGKDMRTAVLPSNAHLPFAVHSFVDCLQGESKKILFVGNSMINRAILSYFLSKNYKNLSLCTRTKKVPFPAIQLKEWQELEKWMDYDVVISGTYYDGYIIRPCTVHHPIVLFDLGVPRNIDPSLAYHPHIRLYNIDDLGKMANQVKKTSERKVQLCETMIEKVVERQMELFQRKQQSRWRYVAECEKLSILP